MTFREALLRLFALGLASIFVLPSCFTSMVWRQTDSYREVAHDSRVETLVARDGHLLAVRVAEAQIAELAPLVPGLSPQSPWLVARPKEAQATFARLLAWRAAPRPKPVQRPDRVAFTIAVRQPFEGDSQPAALYAWLGGTAFGAELQEFWHADGVRRTSSLYGISAVFDVQVEVAAAAAPPSGLEEVERGVLRLCREELREAAPSVLTKILVTPPVFLVDVLLLPFELIALPAWW
jgi:hypothetical protein